MTLVRSKVTEAEPVCLVIGLIVLIWNVRLGMVRIKTTRSGENSSAPNSERPSRRAQTASYRKSKYLGRKSKDLDEGSRAQAKDVQGRELSVYKTPTTQPESSSSDSSEEDRKVLRKGIPLKKILEKSLDQKMEITKVIEMRNGSVKRKKKKGRVKRWIYTSKWSKKEDHIIRALVVRPRVPHQQVKRVVDVAVACRVLPPSEGERASALKIVDEVLKHLTAIGASGPPYIHCHRVPTSKQSKRWCFAWAQRKGANNIQTAGQEFQALNLL
ncbi:hypothetical protein Syun_019203 [Stephania yunnanensis]|uniref:Uncharacterized protein n=1 Tax=Stephania yunnanensis TaxID=152371 RepID=A0AAP0NZ69_9MAGN